MTKTFFVFSRINGVVRIHYLDVDTIGKLNHDKGSRHGLDKSCNQTDQK